MNLELIEKVAEAIYRHNGDLTDENFLKVYGKPRKAWKNNAPNELNEWQRNDYRTQAKAALDVVVASLAEHGVALFEQAKDVKRLWGPIEKRVPSFKEAWEKKKIEGYQYGADALEQVRMGWDMRAAYEKGKP